MELASYFKRIHYTANPSPNLDTLRALHLLHPSHIPFENIDVLLDYGIDLEPLAVEQKIITQRRGGYCFEHNGLFMRVLKQIGFEVEPMIARVQWNVPEDAPPSPRTHMVLKVRIHDQWYLTDVGYGGNVLTTPLLLESNEPQSTHHEVFRVLPIQQGFRLEAQIENQWLPVYDISHERQLPIDFEVANWYTSKHPQSKFRHNLMAARATENTRYTLLNNRLTIRTKGKPAIKQRLQTEELKLALAEHFKLPVTEQWHPLLEKLCHQNP